MREAVNNVNIVNTIKYPHIFSRLVSDCLLTAVLTCLRPKSPELLTSCSEGPGSSLFEAGSGSREVAEQEDQHGGAGEGRSPSTPHKRKRQEFCSK